MRVHPIVLVDEHPPPLGGFVKPVMFSLVSLLGGVIPWGKFSKFIHQGQILDLEKLQKVQQKCPPQKRIFEDEGRRQGRDASFGLVSQAICQKQV